MLLLNAYIFVLAAVLAVVSIIVIFKINIDKVMKNPNQIATIQKNFFIGIALSKIIPVILLFYGIIKMTHISNISKLYIPWLIILGLVVYAFFYISSKNKLDVDQDTKLAISILVTIARPLTFSIPIMAAALLFMMTM